MSIADAVYYRVAHPEIRNDVVGMTLHNGKRVEVLVDGKGRAHQYRDDDGVTVADPRIEEDVAEFLKLVGWQREVWEGGTPDLLYLDPISGGVAGRGLPQAAMQAEVGALKLQVAELRQKVDEMKVALDRHFVAHASVTRVGDTLPDSFVTTAGGLVGETEIVTPAAPMPKRKASAKQRADEGGDEKDDDVAPNADALKALGQG